VERTRSLRLSHPKINVALSLYSQEDRSSLYAVTDYLQTPSELDFDFDDIVVNSTAYRRVLAAAGRPVSTAKQDDSERLTAFAEVSDDVASFRKNLEASHDRLMRDRDIEDRTGSSCYGGDTGSLSIDHMEDAVAACEPRLIAEETPAEAEKLDFERLSEEKMAEFDQMVLELEAEKRQRIAEYAARQSELDRIKGEHERDMERTQQAREEFERQRKESEQRIQELLEAQAMTEPARAGGDVRTIDKMQNQTEPVVI
jgi:septal ring factor EnvC (AmiA/AmiB activator)